MESKEIKNKKRIEWVSLFMLLFTIAGVLTIVVLFETNKDYQIEIKSRDFLIKNSQLRDSLYALQTKENAAVVNQYVEGCEVVIDGKKYTISDLLSNISRLKNEKLIDSIDFLNEIDSIQFEKANLSTLYNNAVRKSDFYQKLYDSTGRGWYDSLRLYKSYYNTIKRKYGISATLIDRDGKHYIQIPVNKIDSALQIFPLLKNRVSYDTVSKTWKVNITGLHD